MMSHLYNRCAREFLILTRTWFAFGLPSKTGCDNRVPVRYNEGSNLDQRFLIGRLMWTDTPSVQDKYKRALEVKRNKPTIPYL
jgi:hypothetical protein